MNPVLADAGAGVADAVGLAPNVKGCDVEVVADVDPKEKPEKGLALGAGAEVEVDPDELSPNPADAAGCIISICFDRN